MLRHDCQGYVALMRNTSVEDTCVKNVLIVSEFIEIFPKKFPGMPLDREIEFCIDIVLGTNSISVPPYKMALEELKELKE